MLEGSGFALFLLLDMVFLPVETGAFAGLCSSEIVARYCELTFPLAVLLGVFPVYEHAIANQF